MPSLITTNPIALRLLLRDDIYDIQEDISKAPEKPPCTFNYHGENNAFCLVLLNSPEHEFAGSEVLKTLENILKGKKLELKDIALLNFSKYSSAVFSDLKDFFACSKMVLFGIDPRQIGLPNLPGNEISIHGGVKILPTYSFEEMTGDEQKKRLFWNEMKKI